MRIRKCLIIAAAGACGFTQTASGGETHPPNFVFFLVDDLGWGDLSYNGCPYVKTPNVDSLSKQGVVFNNAYAAAPYCSPSRAAILSGRSPAALHLTSWINNDPAATVLKWKNLNLPDPLRGLPLSEITLAEVLQARGYQTVNIGKWHIGEGDERPTNQGFNEQIGWWPWSWPKSWFPPYGLDNLPSGPKGEYLTDRLGDEACGFLERNQEKPFLLYYAFYAVHEPLQCKDNLVQKYLTAGRPVEGPHNATYEAMKECMDSNVGKVLRKLDELGLSENTVVIFTSDNGGQRKYSDNGPLRDGKGSCYDGGIRVPLIIRWPGVTPPDSLCREPVTGLDWYPTLLEIAGIERTGAEKQQKLEGVSLVPLLKDPSAHLDRETLCWHFPHAYPWSIGPHGAIRQGKYKLVDFYCQNRWELYDLDQDIGEQHDLSKQMPEVAQQMREKLHRWLQATDAQMPSEIK